MSAKNYQHRLMCIEVIVWNVIVVFFETQCRNVTHRILRYDLGIQDWMERVKVNQHAKYLGERSLS